MDNKTLTCILVICIFCCILLLLYIKNNMPENLLYVTGLIIMVFIILTIIIRYLYYDEVINKPEIISSKMNKTIVCKNNIDNVFSPLSQIINNRNNIKAGEIQQII